MSNKDESARINYKNTKKGKRKKKNSNSAKNRKGTDVSKFYKRKPTTKVSSDTESIIHGTSMHEIIQSLVNDNKIN